MDGQTRSFGICRTSIASRGSNHCWRLKCLFWLISSFATQVLSALYSLSIIVIGLVLSLATAFTHQPGQESYYLQVRYYATYQRASCIVALHAEICTQNYPFHLWGFGPPPSTWLLGPIAEFIPQTALQLVQPFYDRQTDRQTNKHTLRPRYNGNNMSHLCTDV